MLVTIVVVEAEVFWWNVTVSAFTSKLANAGSEEWLFVSCGDSSPFANVTVLRGPGFDAPLLDV